MRPFRCSNNLCEKNGPFAALLVGLAATCVVTPMLFFGNTSGHDFLFHLASWMDVARQWHEGILYPRWAEWANWGFGEPRFVFYPPGSWIAGAALGSVFPWSVAPIIFIWLTLITSGITMWKLTCGWLPGLAPVFATVLYEVNPYHLVIVYQRSDFAELLAGSFLPLLIWAAVEVTGGRWNRVSVLAASFAIIWLCDVPAGIVATYSLFLLLSVACVLRKSTTPLALGVIAMTAGWALAAFFILPAGLEQRWVQISAALSNHLSFSRNFVFTQSNEPPLPSSIFNWQISGVALVVILMTGAAVVFAARKRTQMRDAWWMLTALAVSAVLLMLSPAAPLWRHLPTLRFVQFPWRWLEPLNLACAFFVGAAIDLSFRRRFCWIAISGISIVVVATGVFLAKDARWDNQGTTYLVRSIASNHGYEGTDEYSPLGLSILYEVPGALSDLAFTTDPAEIARVPSNPPIELLDSRSNQAAPAAGVQVHIEKWTAESKIVEADTPKPITLALRLVNYPAWRARLDNRTVDVVSEETTGRILVVLAPGQHRLELRLLRTTDRVIGGLISIASSFGLFACYFALRHRNHRLGLARRS